MTDRLLIKHSTKQEPGTWSPVEAFDGIKAIMVCPDCEKLGTLYDHEVLLDGVVHPSVVCYNENCNFHRYVVLERWNEFV